MTPEQRARALQNLCQRYYPYLWMHLGDTTMRVEWLRTMAGLPPREWLVLIRLEKQLETEGRDEGVTTPQYTRT